MTVVRLHGPPHRWHRIEIPDVGDFEIEVRMPTLAEVIADQARRDWPERAGTRVEAVVVGWRNLDDAQGEPIPFSHENLMQLCSQTHQAVGLQIIVAASSVFQPLGEDQRKNSDAPSPEPSAEAASSTLESTASPGSDVPPPQPV